MINIDASTTIGDLVISGRRLFVECMADHEYPCRRAELDPRSFPRDVPWRELATRDVFRCSSCGGTTVRVKLRSSASGSGG